MHAAGVASGDSVHRASHPRHLRPALRQRADPPRPPGRVHPDRHLGALPEARGNRCIYICADDTHGTAIMIRARKEGRQRGGVDRRHAGSTTSATSPASTSSSTTTAARTARRTASCAASSGQSIRKAGLVDEARRRAALRSRRPGRFWPTGSSTARAPSASRPISTATTASKCGHHYSPTDLIDPVSTLSGATPEVRDVAAPVRRAREAARVSWTSGRNRASTCSRRSPTT